MISLHHVLLLTPPENLSHPTSHRNDSKQPKCTPPALSPSGLWWCDLSAPVLPLGYEFKSSLPFQSQLRHWPFPNTLPPGCPQLTPMGAPPHGIPSHPGHAPFPEWITPHGHCLFADSSPHPPGLVTRISLFTILPQGQQVSSALKVFPKCLLTELMRVST